jgi:putative transposase
MARLPRFVLPGYPQHVIQRGNNRQRILFDEEDYWFLWDKLKAAAEKFSCDLHAYVLMPNHFHILVTPGVDNGIGKLMQYVGRYYVQYFNRRYDRTGTLWEGRYRATLLDPAEFLLPCSRYIEENPVRMGFVDSPAEYAWSSYACNATGEADELITHPVQYLRWGAPVPPARAPTPVYSPSPWTRPSSSASATPPTRPGSWGMPPSARRWSSSSTAAPRREPAGAIAAPPPIAGPRVDSEPARAPAGAPPSRPG